MCCVGVCRERVRVRVRVRVCVCERERERERETHLLMREELVFLAWARISRRLRKETLCSFHWVSV